ncbi:uncharacterized protein [Lolium perenne]|uniref:uncharacterized protein n=1 Tax=Lolium perenne TaxID=4522 RepID=UPI003A996E2F
MALECEDVSTKLADAVITDEHDNSAELANCLESQIGRNVHVYIDDVVVKTTRQADLITDHAETFANLRRYKIKLNPLKCTFGVPSGQLLGYVVSKRGIEPNPEKTLAVMRTKQPTCLVDAQKLAGRVAALSHFIPRLGDKATPLYRLLKKSESFKWTEEAQRALEELQHALQNAPILAAPLPQETMLLYVVASNRAISAVMVVERKEEGKEQLIQHPVYYISEALIDSKQRHPSVRAPRELDIAEPPAPDSTLVALASDSDDWMEPYLSYLERQVLPMDETEARAIVRRCKSFTIINKELYKRSVSGVFQRCIGADEGRKILRDIHAGDCGHPAGACSIVAKAFRHGFYWPTAHEDVVALVRSCAGCQKYASQSHMPGSALKTIPLTCPFAVWGLDMVGKLKTAPGRFTRPY